MKEMNLEKTDLVWEITIRNNWIPFYVWMKWAMKADVIKKLYEKRKDKYKDLSEHNWYIKMFCAQFKVFMEEFKDSYITIYYIEREDEEKIVYN